MKKENLYFSFSGLQDFELSKVPNYLRVLDPRPGPCAGPAAEKNVNGPQVVQVGSSRRRAGSKPEMTLYDCPRPKMFISFLPSRLCCLRLKTVKNHYFLVPSKTSAKKFLEKESIFGSFQLPCAYEKKFLDGPVACLRDFEITAEKIFCAGEARRFRLRTFLGRSLLER